MCGTFRNNIIFNNGLIVCFGQKGCTFGDNIITFAISFKTAHRPVIEPTYGNNSYKSTDCLLLSANYTITGIGVRIFGSNAGLLVRYISFGY